MTPKVESVARAICRTAGDNPDELHVRLETPRWHQYTRQAQAAIDALALHAEQSSAVDSQKPGWGKINIEWPIHPIAMRTAQVNAIREAASRLAERTSLEFKEDADRLAEFEGDHA